MKIIQNLLGGLAGAIALNIIHETYRQLDPDAPKIHLVGEEAVTKISAGLGVEPPEGDALYATTLGGDVLSNALYYAMAGLGNDQQLVTRGAAYGLAAGIGALKLTAPLGLDDAPVNRTVKTRVLTVAWYTIGGLVAGLAMRALRKTT